MSDSDTSEENIPAAIPSRSMYLDDSSDEEVDGFPAVSVSATRTLEDNDLLPQSAPIRGSSPMPPDVKPVGSRAAENAKNYPSRGILKNNAIPSTELICEEAPVLDHGIGPEALAVLVASARTVSPTPPSSPRTDFEISQVEDQPRGRTEQRSRGGSLSGRSSSRSSTSETRSPSAIGRYPATNPN